MEFWVDKFACEIKELVEAKMELLTKKDIVRNSIKNGEIFFSSGNKSQKDLEAGSKRMLELLAELGEIDRGILDIDTIIVSNLEMYLGNFIAKFKMPARLNEAGDLIEHQEVFAVPYKLLDNAKEVTPEDIWFLKMIKEAYKATNITFIEK